jgi:hypothetical protein
MPANSSKNADALIEDAFIDANSFRVAHGKTVRPESDYLQDARGCPARYGLIVPGEVEENLIDARHRPVCVRDAAAR